MPVERRGQVTGHRPISANLRRNDCGSGLRMGYGLIGRSQGYTRVSCVLEADLMRIGAAVARGPLPHHRAYGSVHGRSSRLR